MDIIDLGCSRCGAIIKPDMIWDGMNYRKHRIRNMFPELTAGLRVMSWIGRIRHRKSPLLELKRLKEIQR